MLTERDRRIYLDEIRSRVGYALRAWGDAQDALHGRSDIADFWYSMNSFLNSAVAVANIVWPSNRSGKVQRRAIELRQVIGAAPSAPAGLRDVRNGFEHFDERLDAWRETSVSRNFVDSNLGPRNAVSAGGFAPEDVARHFDESTNELGVFGKYMNVQKVADELEHLIRGLGSRRLEVSREQPLHSAPQRAFVINRAAPTNGSLVDVLEVVVSAPLVAAYFKS